MAPLTDVNHITSLPGYVKNGIAQFLDVKDALHLAATSKNLHRTLLRLYVPPGFIFENPITWSGDNLGTPRKYRRIPLLAPSGLRKVVVSLQWRDRGSSPTQEGQIFIVATDGRDLGPTKSKPSLQPVLFEGGRLVHESPFANCDYEPLRFSFRPMPDETYHLWYKIGTGHKLTLRNVRLEPTETMLYQACMLGDYDKAALMLQQGAYTDASECDGWTPLHEACENGHDSIVALLLRHGAHPNARDNQARVPLYVACKNNRTPCVELLLKHYAKPNVEDNKGRTPLQEALWKGNESIIALLLQSKAYPNARSIDGLTLLHEACKKGWDSVVQSLLKNFANPNAKRRKDGWAPLHLACENNHESIVRLLLNHRAETNVFATDGWTPLHEACKNRNGTIVALLLERKAYPNVRNKYWRTALHEACEQGCDSIVEMLLSKGANPNATSKGDVAPLHVACKHRHESIVNLLLNHGSDPNAASNDGWTPLHEACKNGSVPIAALLLTNKANPNATNTDGRSPLHEACENLFYSVAVLLLQYKADPNATIKDGRAPVEMVCNDKAFVELLLWNGAHLNGEKCEDLDAVKCDDPNGAKCEDLNGAKCEDLDRAKCEDLDRAKCEDLDRAKCEDRNGAKCEGPLPTTLLKSTTCSPASLVASLFHPDSANGLVLPTFDKLSENWQPVAASIATAWISSAMRAGKKLLPEKVTALEKVLRSVASDAGPTFNLHLATLHAMNDNLVAEALALGFSVDEIAIAMFACWESRTWLHNFLLVQLQTSEMLIKNILSVSHGRALVGCYEFADALVYLSKDCFRMGLSTEKEELDLNDYTKVPFLFVEDDRMEARKFLKGMYRIKGSKITCALVPGIDGVTYYLHKDHAYLLREDSRPNSCHTAGKGPHRVQAAVDQMVALGCDKLLAWRLFSNAKSSRLPVDDVCNKIVEAFKIISDFRTQLKKAITDSPTGKRLLGTKEELHQISCEQKTAPCFVIGRSLYTTAQQRCGFGNHDTLEPFKIDPKLNARKFQFDLFGKLVEKAKEIGGKSRLVSRFDALNVLVLGVLNDRNVMGTFISKYLRACYYCQDDIGTKGLCTPFSKLTLVISNENYWIPEQVQHLENETSSLKNWIALRAAFEFDVENDQFLFGTSGFEEANAVIKRSIGEFVRHTTSPFSRMLSVLPSTVAVSYLRTLCEKVAKLTGASSAWLIREMVSRFILAGADVSGPEQNVGYGMMELTMKQIHAILPSSTKVLYFDEKVPLEGVLCRENQNGRICLREHRSGKAGSQVVLFDDRVDVVDECFCDVFPTADRVVA